MTGTTRSPARFPALDGARAFAAFGVVLTHVGFNSGRSLDAGPLAPFLSRLDFGVTLFFLLSGFVIYRPYLAAAFAHRDLPSARGFLARRAIRILPAYWVVIAATLGVLSLRTADSADWWHYLLLIQTYDSHNVDPSLTQMWTLSVELSFYLLVPLLASWACGARTNAGVVRRNLVLVGTLLVVALASSTAAHYWPALGLRSLIWLPANVDWFALGMLMALVSAYPGRATQGEPALPQWQGRSVTLLRTLAGATGSCWALAGLAFWFATLPLAGPRSLLVPTAWEWFLKHSLYSVCALLLLVPLTLGEPGRWSAVLEWRPVRFLGEISYGVYLWHLPLLLAIQHGLGYPTFSGHFWELLALTCAATVVMASASWVLLERPLIRAVQRRYSSAVTSGSAAESRIVNTASAASTAP